MRDAPLAARFSSLVQSPLRASLLRFLHAHQGDTFDVERLMHTFGRMRLDVENCLTELEGFGVAARAGNRGYRYVPPGGQLRALIDAFVARRAEPSQEERSEAALRFREMLGRDEKMLIIFEWVRTAAKADIAVLILGPTGSGKEVVARMIHELSRRRERRFEAVNCAAVPEALFESEMFGYEKGAFTGASARKIGRLELADEGTFFLDEISELAPPMQGKLLRALEEQRFERLGAQKSIGVDFRLISATNRPIEQMVREGRFREDLYYRVNAFSIRLPSLRERAGDIPMLAERFLARHTSGLDTGARRFSASAMKALEAYGWPGNIRELDSAVARAVLSAEGPALTAKDFEFLSGPAAAARAPASTPGRTLADAERGHILSVLDATGWNKRRTAEILDISRGTLYRKIADYALRPSPVADL
ncbi:MAG: sigma-54 dependent transcriptional regulator [Acidobacteriota bacterium]|nr:sigma-54 dependent transcriptional regulator [Acidobacteriota bacterium]